MIKATELRLNNLLQYENEVAPVNAIWSNGNYELHSDVLQFWTIEAGDELVTGIPLTPEWLERFGFLKDGFGAYNKDISNFEGEFKTLSFSGDYLYIRQGNKENGREGDDLVSLWNKDLMRVFYVHQLQNLYYALTGEELTLNQ